MANANNDIQKIKDTLGQEVVPAITGKPSRVLKEKPKQRPQKVTAAGASLYEIAAAIRKDPTLTVDEAIRQGKRERKEEERAQYGIGGKGKREFLTGALGTGVGGFISNLIDTRANRAQKKEEATLADLPRQFEEGSATKANFLRGLLGDKVGGFISRATTSMGTKTAALEKYQQITSAREQAELGPTPSASKVAFIRQPVQAPPPKPRASPERDEAHKALGALGYSKAEITQRLQNAPENASTEELVRHGLNPTVTPVPASTVPHELSSQEQAVKLGGEEDTKNAIKKQEEHNKKVEKSLEEIKKKLGSRGGGLLDGIIGKVKNLLGSMFGGLLGLVPKFATLIPSLIKFLGPAALVAGAGFAGYKLGQYLDKKFELHEKAVSGVEKAQTLFHEAKAKITGEPLTKEDAIKQGVMSFYDGGDKSKGVILTRQEAQRSVAMGHTLPLQQGKFFSDHPEVEQAWAKGHPDLTAKPRDTVGVIVRPKAPPLTAPQVGAISAEQKDLASEKSAEGTGAILSAVESVGQAAVASSAAALDGVKKILPAVAKSGSTDAGGVIVKVRNDESSQAAYVAQIFDHPASWGGIGRM